MKATGIIRRIDELGRLVIPKEIRRNLKIRDGENMEIFIDESSIILKKYSKMEDALTYVKNITELLGDLTNEKIIVTDRDKIIATVNIYDEINNKLISNKIIDLLNERKNITSEYSESLEITSDYKPNMYYSIFPIISGSDSMGVIILLSDNKIDNEFKILMKFISLLISSKLDI